MAYKTLNDLGQIIPLASSPTTAPIIHSAIATLAFLAVSQTQQACFYLSAFALAVSSAWHVYYPNIHTANLFPHFP